MLQSVSTSQFSNPALSGSGSEGSSSDPLLRFAGSIAGSHVLVIAPNGLNLMCDLLRRGCAAVTTVRHSERSDHQCYDLVLAPWVVSAAHTGKLVHQAKRALAPTGRLLAIVPHGPDQYLPGSLIHSIRTGGFVAVQTRTLAIGLMVRADLPMAGMWDATPAPLERQA